MKLIAHLEDLLYKAQTSPADQKLKIRDWRIVVHEAQLISLGIKDNEPGSVYTPPSYRQGESGEVVIVWEDGRLSQARVQAVSGKNAQVGEEQLQEWYQAAYEDPDGREIPAPEAIPLVAVEDRAVQRILAGEDEILFEQVSRLLKDRPEQAEMQAGIQAAWGYRHIRNSKGLAVTYQESQYALSYSFDSLVGGWFAKRRLISEEEWVRTWQQTLEYYQAMQQEADPVGTQTTVVFSPGVLDSFLEQFIVPNFVGQSILEGQSAFRVEHFEKQEQVFNEGLTLMVDPLRPFELGSYLVTSEGIAAERTVLVQDGVLKTPFLRVKDARRWGVKPTALPQGTSGLYLKHNQEESWSEVLAGIEDGILILSVLGMHTQNSVAGEYSLSAPQSLRIENGKIVGKTDVKLSGNFFKDLKSPYTRFAKSELFTKPYILVKTGLQTL
ncbi:metallopeptidase TldD-related protein [Desulfitobacterium metallireducens]|uniref:Peptidase n=1 Tax=Desulfitobacterium metallireducens DSM 15288 TaxID=871968 RepID=W0EA71_9FIRM|nr:metallopeptidase TldD-related protein [Desulfitobacterium metallireducens]AHF07745.1 peptidase [Desulfitobacterium metallireducens DSM 15288]